MNRKLILASASPRRKDILQTAGYSFDVITADVDEENVIEEVPEQLVMKLAHKKAEAVYNKLCREGTYETGMLVIGADTLVFCNNNRMGKPTDADNWREMLEQLSGRIHEVITGVCLMYDGQCECFYAVTDVCVAKLSEEEINEHINQAEDGDKAGGYAIQGSFGKYITSINGEYNNVVGFPLAKFYEKIKELKLD